MAVKFSERRMRVVALVIRFTFLVRSSRPGLPERVAGKKPHSHGIGLWTCSGHLRKWCL